MPLIMLFGQPGHAQDELVKQVLNLATQSNYPVSEVSPTILGFSQSELISKQSYLNKQLYQAVQNHLSQQHLVIVNHSNHLKSFRYELFCLAREKKTSSCVLSTYNPQFVPQNEQEIDLCSRFELLLEAEWDTPVFTAANEAFEFSTQPKKKFAKKATAMNKFKQIPLFELLQGAIQRINQQQSTIGAVCNVQLYDSVYFTCTRQYSILELKNVSEAFKKGYVGSGDNYEQAEGFRKALEQM
ncbi:Chromatin_associated protein KTI12 [Hexamita inflata]|uniref:Chromatin associated protein KTI12 n=1 Tax=Hexamita inflata TaxID=28002 RepID=A0AA86TSN7_9EUKA|nr:Chromatin associated protein KTI12 [Hexamita inflata]